jgi:dolichyldiphosphatase
MAAAEPIPLASLSVTHVYYDPDDPLSLFCAYLALIPQGLCVVYVTLVLFTREVEIGLTFTGQVACEVLSFVLKRLIKEQRPPRMHGNGYGMPSSHAQFMAFWSLSVVLFLLVRHRPPAASTAKHPDASYHQPWSFVQRLGVGVAAVALAALTAWSRIYLNYHTPRQVVAGLGAGILFALVWFAAVGVLRATGWLAWGLDLPIAKAVRLRDLAVEEDMCQAGWEKWVDRKMASNAKVAAGKKRR